VACFVAGTDLPGRSRDFSGLPHDHAPTLTLLDILVSSQHHHSDRKPLLVGSSLGLSLLISNTNTMMDSGCQHTKAGTTFLSLVASCDEYDHQPGAFTLELH
jgi:hypothetical protein